MGIYLSGGYRSPHAGFYRDSGHVIENNYIHHVGRKARASSAISANGVGYPHRPYNLIHDSRAPASIPAATATGSSTTTSAMSTSRHRMPPRTTCATATSPSTTPRSASNWIHDVLGLHLVGDTGKPCHFTFGIYLDDFTSGVDIHGNLIVRTPRGGVFTHAPPDVRVTNNVIVDSDRALRFVRRWGRGLEYERLGTHGIALTRNAFTGNIPGSTMPDSVVYAVRTAWTRLGDRHEGQCVRPQPVSGWQAARCASICRRISAMMSTTAVRAVLRPGGPGPMTRTASKPTLLYRS